MARANLPRIRGNMLMVGLAITGCGWLVQGWSLWAVVEAIAADAWPGNLAETWWRCAAYAALAYAAGFLVLPAPGGLGVRDFIIQQFLAADLSPALGKERAAAVAVLAALLLRLLWTVMDVG